MVLGRGALVRARVSAEHCSFFYWPKNISFFHRVFLSSFPPLYFSMLYFCSAMSL